MSPRHPTSMIDPRHPSCHNCQTKRSIYWRVPARDLVLCNNCFLTDCRTSHQFCKIKTTEDLSAFDSNVNTISKDEQMISSSSSSSSSIITKGKRLKPIESNKSQLTLKISTRQHQQPPTSRSSRKSLAFKAKKPEKCALPSISFRLYDVLYSKGRRFALGDIVYLIDSNLSCFYAQIRALFQDEHVNAFAFLTWLLPNTPNPTSFDPNTFTLGPDEEYPRSLNALCFVCHAPSDYFQVKTYPQSMLTETKRRWNYTWSQLSDQSNENDSINVKRRR